MPVSNRELEALRTVQRYGGQIGYGVVAQVMGISTDYARSICTGLGRADYIDLTSSGLCIITPKGMNELIGRGIAPPSAQLAFQTQEAVGPAGPFVEQRAPRSEQAVPGEMVDVKCAYCWGRGTDPFGCPSPTSKCSVCGGRGYNRVVAPYAPCSACGGTGKQPGRRLTCTTCKGKGVMTVREAVGRPRPFVRPATPTSREAPIGGDGGAPRIASVRGTVPTPPGTAIRGRARPRRSRRTSQAVPLAERASAHIANFPGARAEDVEALLGLSESEAKGMLQSLVKAGRIRERDDLYYPA